MHNAHRWWIFRATDSLVQPKMCSTGVKQFTQIATYNIMIMAHQLTLENFISAWYYAIYIVSYDSRKPMKMYPDFNPL